MTDESPRNRESLMTDRHNSPPRHCLAACRHATIVFAACGALGAAEVSRRDLLLATEFVDGGFTYTVDSPIGSLSGSDSFDRIALLRLGGRWAWSTAGSSLAPLAGIVGEYTDAPLSGGGLRGYGLAAVAGGTWAISDPLALDLEGFVGLQRVSINLPSSVSGGALDATGDQLRSGLRVRLGWHVARHWSLGLEGGFVHWSADLSGGDGRSVSLDGSGPSVGLALAWRPSDRPGSIE